MISDIDIIVFDLGGVMIRLAGGWEGSCACAGIPFRSFTMSLEDMQVIESLEGDLSINRITPEEYYQGLYGVTCGLYSQDELAAIYQAVICEEFPGIYDAVLALKSSGYRTACLSNTCAPHWVDLTNPARYPAICALDIRHASHLLGVAKPDPLIYRRFETLTESQPGQILFFDDREENVNAAKACGWHAVQITPGRPSVEQIHDALTLHGVRVAQSIPTTR